MPWPRPMHIVATPNVGVVLLHHIEQRGRDARAGAAERVTERDRAAVQVDPGVVILEQSQVLDHGQGLRGERLVQFRNLHALHVEIRARQCLPGGRDWDHNP